MENINTAAQIVANTVNSAKTDRDGFLLSGRYKARFEDFCGFKFHYSYPMDTDSFYPTIIATFSDGSQIRVSNGNQSTFKMFVQVIDPAPSGLTAAERFNFLFGEDYDNNGHFGRVLSRHPLLSEAVELTGEGFNSSWGWEFPDGSFLYSVPGQVSNTIYTA